MCVPLVLDGAVPGRQLPVVDGRHCRAPPRPYRPPGCRVRPLPTGRGQRPAPRAQRPAHAAALSALAHAVCHAREPCTQHRDLFVFPGNQASIVRQCPPLPPNAFLAVTSALRRIGTALLPSDSGRHGAFFCLHHSVRVGALWATSGCTLSVHPPRQSLSSLVHLDQTFEVITDAELD